MGWQAYRARRRVHHTFPASTGHQPTVNGAPAHRFAAIRPRPRTIGSMANRLAGETSPYLLQHAHNPVDWYPWGPDALAAARLQDRPIFLSIGYAACHWCHVMERESFEHEPTARYLNDHFVSIKVDREERPDLDQVYMAAVQSMTGGGGWPMSVFLTPDGRPFYGGTYFPDEPRHGMPSFRQVLEGVDRAWREGRDEVEAAGGRLVAGLVAQGRIEAGPDDPTADLLDAATAAIEASFDWANGGWGRAPKFPQPMTIEYELRRAAATGDPRPLMVARRSLDAMADGGVRDQLGGGFHRYSTDARVARAALRADALRQRPAGPGLRPRLEPHRRPALPRRRRGRPRLHAPRADDRGWRVRREPGRRHRRDRGPDLHLARRRDPGGAGRRAPTSSPPRTG